MTRTRPLFGAGLLLALFVLSLAFDPAPLTNRAFLTDLRAFVCGGAVRAGGADPYRVEPLRTCEHRLDPSGRNLPPEVVAPAPLPGYALALVSQLAKLPFPTAAMLWELLVLLALGITVAALCDLTALAPVVVLATLLLSDAMPSLFFGQVVPFAVAGISAAMWCLKRERYAAASCCAAFALIEPHIGVGACLALALFAPRCRVPLALCTAALGALSLAFNTPGGELEYLRAVLPTHALAEIRNEDQYSLSYLLHLVGVEAHTAVSLGTLSYLVMLIVGLLSARIAARVTGERAFLAAIPPAFAAIGGPFIHIHQMAAALPAALLALAHLPQRRPFLGTAILLLAIPWSHFFLLDHLTPVVLAIAFLIATRVLQLAPVLGIACSGSIALLLWLAPFGFTPPLAVAPPPTPPPDALAEASWGPYVTARHSGNALLFLGLKLPTWTALLLTAFNLPKEAR